MAFPDIHDLGLATSEECNGEPSAPKHSFGGDAGVIWVFATPEDATNWLTSRLRLVTTAADAMVECIDPGSGELLYTIEGPTSVEATGDGAIMVTARYHFTNSGNVNATDFLRICENVILSSADQESGADVALTLGCSLAEPTVSIPTPPSVTEPAATTPTAEFALQVVRDAGAGPVTIALSALAISEEIASAPIGLKILILTGTMTVDNASSRNLNGPPVVWLAHDGTECPPLGEDATDPQGNEWCLAIGSMPGDGYQIATGNTRDFVLDASNAGYRGASAVPFTVGEQRDLSTVFVCLSTANSGYAPWSCVNQDGETLTLDH